MSLTNVYHLHQKTGTNFRVTRRDMIGDRGSQVGLVDLPTHRSDEGRVELVFALLQERLFKQNACLSSNLKARLSALPAAVSHLDFLL